MENLREVLNFRKKTERFGRGEEGFLVKKGCKEGGGSL
nr:glycosyltransferase [Capnocytophaga sp. oral taxon 412]